VRAAKIRERGLCRVCRREPVTTGVGSRACWRCYKTGRAGDGRARGTGDMRDMAARVLMELRAG
jgi:hypothetical protein